MSKFNIPYLAYCATCDRPCIVLGLDEDEMDNILECGNTGESWTHISIGRERLRDDLRTAIMDIIEDGAEVDE